MPVNRHHVFFEKAQYQRHRLVREKNEKPYQVSERRF